MANQQSGRNSTSSNGNSRIPFNTSTITAGQGETANLSAQPQGQHQGEGGSSVGVTNSAPSSSRSSTEDLLSMSRGSVADQERLNTAFLSNVQQSTHSLSTAASVPSLGPGAYDYACPGRRSNHSMQYSLQSTTTHTNNSPPSSISASEGTSMWDTTIHTGATTAFSFPTLTASSSQQSSPQAMVHASQESNTENAVVPYAESVVSVPSQVLPTTTLENAVSGLTTAVPADTSTDPSQDFLQNIQNDNDNETTSTFHRILPQTQLNARTTTSSSLTTISTTMANHHFHQQSLLHQDPHAQQPQPKIGSSSSSSSSSSVTITTALSLREELRNNTNNTATTNTANNNNSNGLSDEDAKLKAASEFIPPPPTIASVPHGEDTLQELEDMVVAKRGVTTSTRNPTTSNATHDFGTQQRLLEEKLTRQQQQQEEESTLDPHQLMLQGGNLPVVQELSILEELEALNRSASEEDPYNVARRRATFVRPGAYHQAPGQVAIRRARSSANSLQLTQAQLQQLQNVQQDDALAPATTNLNRHESQTTTTSDISSIGMGSYAQNAFPGNSSNSNNTMEVSGPQRQLPTRRHTYSGHGHAAVSPGPDGSPLAPDLPPPPPFSSSSSSSVVSLPALTLSVRNEANQTGRSITTNSTNDSHNPLVSPSPRPPESHPRETDTSNNDNDNNSFPGLVRAHPVQPTDNSNIVAADPVDASDPQRRTRTPSATADTEGEHGLHHKAPLSRRTALLWGLVGCLAVCLGVILPVIILRSTASDSASPYPTEGVSSFVPTTKRGFQIQQRLRNEFGIRPSQPQLDVETDPEASPSPLDENPNENTNPPPQKRQSAHHLAMDWLVNVDPMALEPSSDNLLQRYLMAYFYFHTTEESQWVSCNPAQGKETKFCPYRFVNPFDGKYDESPWHIRWLSGEHECEWAGIYCESQSVNELSLNGYNLTGTFPTLITKLYNLTNLSLRDNRLRGSLPSDLSGLSNLRTLRMNRNFFSGTIPLSWGALTALTNLDVGNNGLTGSLPDLHLGIFPLTNLENLWLDHNQFNGTIPSDMSGLPGLKQIFLNSNDFHGPLPNIGNLSQLEFMDFSSNRITGTLPSEIGLLTNLIDIDLSSTSLVGTIPDELYGLEELQDLILSRCNFTGTISTRMGRLVSLQNLLLEGNAFSGELPSELGKLESLMSVQVQHNSFEGAVPDSMCLLKGPNTLTEVIADCATSDNLDQPRVECQDDCCTSCCDASTGICDSN